MTKKPENKTLSLEEKKALFESLKSDLVTVTKDVTEIKKDVRQADTKTTRLEKRLEKSDNLESKLDDLIAKAQEKIAEKNSEKMQLQKDNKAKLSGVGTLESKVLESEKNASEILGVTLSGSRVSTGAPGSMAFTFFVKQKSKSQPDLWTKVIETNGKKIIALKHRQVSLTVHKVSDTVVHIETKGQRYNVSTAKGFEKRIDTIYEQIVTESDLKLDKIESEASTG